MGIEKIINKQGILIDVTDEFGKNMFKNHVGQAQFYLKSSFRLPVSDLRINIRESIPYLKKLFEESQPANSAEFQKVIKKDFEQMEKILFKCNDSINLYNSLIAANYFIAHPDKFDYYYEKVSQPNYDDSSINDDSYEGILESYAYNLYLNYEDYLNEKAEVLYEEEPYLESIINNHSQEPR